MKQNYELTYLISSQLTNEAALAVSQQVNGAVQEAQGLLSESRLPQKINLAYPINKEMTAFLQTTYFGLDPEGLSSVDKKLKETKEILRFLLLRKVEAKRLPPRRVPRKPLATLKTALPTDSTTPSPKVELGEIEKRLDEMLKE